jgi:molecular chaperone DnaK
MRNKIDYGIDLGTTNSSLARMLNGVPVIVKSDTSKDIVPSCVRFTNKQTVMVGELAFNAMQADITRTLKEFEKPNAFIEFKRTMGTSAKYESSYMHKGFYSEELSAEVLKMLKSIVLDEEILSVVITIPAKFGNQQKEATMKAAKLAGFKQVQLLQEPVAAATAYGLGSQSKDGFWLVFDFGGGTFDAALVKAEEGILSVNDTEGDNWLGGKNLDYTIVDEIVLPYLEKNYAIDSILDDSKKKQSLRDFLKLHAETTKNQLSFKKEWALSIELGAFPIKDDNGEEMDVDIMLTSDDMEKVLAPLFQKAIDITKDLLKRKNLKGSQLDKLILVGGPTHSPILRRMLKEQITENVDTSVDPMTVVAKGAALYASTIDVADEIQDEIRDETKLQLDVRYEAASVETEELVNVKVLKEKSTGDYPAELFAEFVRFDDAWSSPKKAISDKKATLMEVQLVEDRSNAFAVNIYDNQGNRIECEPNQFTILQGIGGLSGMQVLPSHICIVKHFADEEKDLILPVKGLEKNKRYPAVGITNGLKTRQTIRPGMVKDVIRIPIYEGEYNAQKTNPSLNNLIFEVIITGESLPALLPEGSDVDITIKVDKSGLMKFSAYFPVLDYTEELEIPVKQTEAIPAYELAKKISKAKSDACNVQANDVSERLENLKMQLEHEKGSVDGRLKIFDALRKELLQLDILEKAQVWLIVEQELKDAYFELEDVVQGLRSIDENSNLNITRIKALCLDFKQKIEIIIREKNIGEARDLRDSIVAWTLEILNEVEGGQVDVDRLMYHDQNFVTIRWKDANKARALINQGKQLIAQDKNNELRPILHQIWNLRIDKDDNGDTLG